ncbi:MAG: hypothetical protein K2G87_07860 [Oscillospiraceae bacterium]|nr:hypothetical protein [Oscillospiraceae bacterium]
MKKHIAAITALLISTLMLSACAEVEDMDEEEESAGQTLTVSDPEYYTRFKGSGP